jgi:hypothetical protein
VSSCCPSGRGRASSMRLLAVVAVLPLFGVAGCGDRSQQELERPANVNQALKRAEGDRTQPLTIKAAGYRIGKNEARPRRQAAVPVRDRSGQGGTQGQGAAEEDPRLGDIRRLDAKKAAQIERQIATFRRNVRKAEKRLGPRADPPRSAPTGQALPQPPAGRGGRPGLRARDGLRRAGARPAPPRYGQRREEGSLDRRVGVGGAGAGSRCARNDGSAYASPLE